MAFWFVFFGLLIFFVAVIHIDSLLTEREDRKLEEYDRVP